MSRGPHDSFRLVRREARAETHDHEAHRQGLEKRSLPRSLLDFERSAPHFRLDAGLETAINMSLAVGSPLLLTGEPGTGKTQVAYYLSWYFSIPAFLYQVRSTASAENLKYDFDAVAYLREAQHPDPQKRRGREAFLQPKALWQAYQCQTDCVLLIDEIDKAPRDFPNDLLQELDKHEFAHPFTDELIRPSSGRPPIVIITSNAERRLPDAFLRRCIFHHIELTPELLRSAVEARAENGDFPRLEPETLQAACQRFWDLRDQELRKRPSTAELLAWLAILSARRVGANELKEVPLAELPGLAALIKDRDDLEQL